MKFDFKNYLNKLLEISEEMKGISQTFVDKDLEENFCKSQESLEFSKSNIFFLISGCSYLFSLGINMSKSNFKFIHTTYLVLIGLFIEICIAVAVCKFKKNIKFLTISKYFRFIFFYFNFIIILMFPSIFPTNLNDAGYVRYIYIFTLANNFINSFCFEYAIGIDIIILIFNSFLICFIQLFFYYEKYFLATEFFANIIFLYINFRSRRDYFILKKKIFIESFKNKQYFDYIQNLINVLNTMVLSLNKEEVLFMNNFATDYFEKRFDLKLREENENVTLISNNLLNPINKYLGDFYDSLILKNQAENNDSEFFQQGKTFNQILSDIFCLKNDFFKENFTRIGNFRSQILNNFSWFEIYYRKPIIGKDNIEVLINDITQMKIAEELNNEKTKYKQKILSKIAHEFKTPLITITSLISKFHQKSDILDNSIKQDIYHINNLSNYTIFLINDIIQYLSDSKNVIISKIEIKIREILEFTFNVLKTLIECNENKVNKIIPSLHIDDKIDEFKIISDENRLKQIILNLVSNAFKFTRNGFIKIEVKCNRTNVEIIIEDSGIGIKEEDHHLIFQDNTQLSNDYELICKGSGLGLSITKNMPESLNHKIRFESNFGLGTKFFIIIKCGKKNNDLFKNNTHRINKNNFNENSIIQEENYEFTNFIRSKSLPNIENRNNERSNESFCLIIKSIENFNLEKTNEINESYYSDKPNNDAFQIISFSIFLGNLIDENKFKIIVVDDHKYVRQNTVNLIKNAFNELKIKNIDIIEASDGIEMLNFIIKDKNNIIKSIFIDENMEYMNGTEAVRILRKMQQDSKIKNYNIDSTSANDDSETKKLILNSGVNSIVSKPCTKSEICNILSNLKENF